LLLAALLVSVLFICSETYHYYSLPFCEPEKKEYESQGLSQVLAGDRTVNSKYVLKFGRDSEKIDLCTKQLSKQDVAKFRNAIASEYYFQVSVCSLPGSWGAWMLKAIHSCIADVL
jgi:transmembrane 9 superfamily member 1